MAQAGRPPRIGVRAPLSSSGLKPNKRSTPSDRYSTRPLGDEKHPNTSSERDSKAWKTRAICLGELMPVLSLGDVSSSLC